MEVIQKKHEGWMQSSTSRDVVETGQKLGRDYGLAESISRQLAWSLGVQAKQHLGGTDSSGQAVLSGLAEGFAVETLKELADGLVTATNWNNWLEGVTVPPKAPGMPDYTQNLEIDLEQSEPSIDSIAEISMPGLGKVLMQMRIQKWFQPELDKHLFESSLKLERKHGKMPMVMVMLMRPEAEGPGVTGKYEGRDANGKQRKFQYFIRKVWEITPEELARSPGTMMLAPLGKGAKQRLPEIVRLMKSSVDRSNVEPHLRETMWIAAYWSIGFVAPLEEAQQAMADVLPEIQNSKPYRSALGQSYSEGYSLAQTEGRLLALKDLIIRQATRRFGANTEMRQQIESQTDPVMLESVASKLFIDSDWNSLLS